MNIYLTKSLQNKIQWRAETNRYINQGVKYTYLVALKLQKVAFLKKLEIKIVDGHSRFQKLQIDNKKSICI